MDLATYLLRGLTRNGGPGLGRERPWGNFMIGGWNFRLTCIFWLWGIGSLLSRVNG